MWGYKDCHKDSKWDRHEHKRKWCHDGGKDWGCHEEKKWEPKHEKKCW